MTTDKLNGAVTRLEDCWTITDHGVGTAEEVEIAILRIAENDAVLAYRLQGYIAAQAEALRIQGERETVLREDAERYRFLRSREPGPELAPVPDGLFIGRVPENFILTGPHADAAIDEARLTSIGESHG